MLDTNSQHIEQAQSEGHEAIRCDATDAKVIRLEGISSVAVVLALTDNVRINEMTCRLWEKALPGVKTYRWANQLAKEWAVSGQAIWTGMPAPSVISAELDQGLVSWLDTGDKVSNLINKESENIMRSALLGIADGNIVLDADAAEAQDQLILLHKGSNLVRFVRFESSGVYLEADEEAVDTEASEIDIGLGEKTDISALQGVAKKDVLAFLLQGITELHPEIDFERTLQDICERELAFSTAIGKGIAIPHSYVSGLSEPLVAIAVVPAGVDFQAEDGEFVHLVFMLLSPVGNPMQHLNLLAEIARLGDHQEYVDRLRQAGSDEELEQLLRWLPEE